MLTFPSLGAMDRSLSVSVYLRTAPTDMRKGFDTLAALVHEHLGRDPLSGDLLLIGNLIWPGGAGRVRGRGVFNAGRKKFRRQCVGL